MFTQTATPYHECSPSGKIKFENEILLHTNQNGHNKKLEVLVQTWNKWNPHMSSAGRNVKWCSHFGKQYGSVSKS